jgi:hypothetical protein
MIRKEIIEEFGKLKPSVNTYDPENINFSSIFIIPIPHQIHKVKDVKNLYNRIQKNWTIKNNTIEKDLSIYDIKKYIKDGTFEKINLKENSSDFKKGLKDFIDNAKHLYLRHNSKKLLLKYEDIKFILTEIDLLIMDNNIAFFTYKIELDKDNLIDVNTISAKLNRNLRDYKNLCIDIDKRKIYTKKSEELDKTVQISLLSYFMSLTYDDKQNSFLNVNYTPASSFDVDSELSIIQTSTYYAKMITAVHVDSSSVNVSGTEEEIAPIANKLSEDVIVDIGILEELSYLFGSTSSYAFHKELEYVSHEGYTYQMIKEKGINIWKLWSGISLQDSVAFVSINQGGANIVQSAKKSNYLIYIINIYVNIRLKCIEHYLIDKDFINIERIIPLAREIQILKNNYITSEISVKFQPNYINERISLGLKNDLLLEEVENNLQITLDITKNNTDIVFSIGAALVSLVSIWLTNNLIIELYNKYPYTTFFTIITLLILIIVAFTKKSMLIRLVKRGLKFIKSAIGI